MLTSTVKTLPARLNALPVLAQGLVVLLASGVLALSSYAEIPMVPVPMTLQTLAVPVIGAVFGWRLGTLAVVAWLAEAALGLPVLAAGRAGLSVFLGPTAGYLAAFPLAALLTGWLAARGWNGRAPALGFAAMLLSNALCLALGAMWLSGFVGVEKAVALGVTPFLIGGLVKSMMGAAILWSLTLGRNRA